MSAEAQSDDVTQGLVEILTEMTGDWDLEFEGSIDRNTQLINDLSFESIDIVELVVAIEERFKSRSIPFEKLLMEEGRYVDDLSVGKVADFVRECV